MIKELKGPQKKIFFASWCPSCKDHLQASQLDKTAIAIVWHDKKESAEKALAALKWSGSCFLDEKGDAAKFYRIETIPAAVSH